MYVLTLSKPVSCWNRARVPGAARRSALAAIAIGVLSGCGGAQMLRVAVPFPAANAGDPLACEDGDRRPECVRPLVEQLHVACEVRPPVDVTGYAIAPCEVADGGWTARGSAGSTLRITARCQAPVEIPIETATTPYAFTMMPPMTIHGNAAWSGADDVSGFLDAPTLLKPLSAGDSQSRSFPVDTEVVMLRDWPDRDGGCSLVAVRVVPRAGLVADGLTERQTSALIASRVFVVERSAVHVTTDAERVARRAAVESAERARIAAAQLAAEEQRLAAADAARAESERVANAEATAGECSEESSRALDGADSGLDALMRSAHLTPIAHDRDVGDLASVVNWSKTLWMPGTYHVIVASWQPLSVDVEIGGAAASSPSPYERLLSGRGWTTSSVRLVADAGEVLDVHVETNGCFAVYVYSELPR